MMDTHDARPLPTLRQLAVATAIAVLVAAAILITVVLPAEYGVDPTGLGHRLGLTAMSSASEQGQAAIPSTSAPANESRPINSGEVNATASVTQSKLPLRTDEMSLMLPPGKGAEIKASMDKGGHFVYEWVSGGTRVEYELHGEPRNAKGDEFTSFLKGTQSSDQGVFIAPFAGTHGWYWENVGEVPVTIRVKVSGFYEKLYKP